MMVISCVMSCGGAAIRLTVDAVEFVRQCPYCAMMHPEAAEFLTLERGQIYCSDSHKVLHWKKTHGYISPSSQPKSRHEKSRFS